MLPPEINAAVKEAAPGALDLPCCRICLSEEDQADLVSPCQCKGSISHVHTVCLNKWRMMQNPASSKKVICQLCKTPYRVVYKRKTRLYRMFVRALSVISLCPIALLAAELVPRIPLRSNRDVDMFGFDVEIWSANAFDWVLSDDHLAVISSIIKNRGGAFTMLREKKSRLLLPILLFGLARAGALGVLLQFFLTNFTIGAGNPYRLRFAPQQQQPHQQQGLVSRWVAKLTPGQAILIHYVLSCFALRCCQTPRTRREAWMFTLTCGWGLCFEASLVENWIRRLVLKLWPQFEVAQLAT